MPTSTDLSTVLKAALEVQAFCESRDWADVDMVLLRQGNTLNVRQIFEELVPLAELKEDSDIVPRLETMMRKRGMLE